MGYWLIIPRKNVYYIYIVHLKRRTRCLIKYLENIKPMDRCLIFNCKNLNRMWQPLTKPQLEQIQYAN
jgi:hypothetical protein